jgi:hypothetical protein
MKTRSRRDDGVFAAEGAAAAKAAGEKHYVSNRPCPQGHIGKRFVSNNGCAECLRSQCKQYYHRNHEVMRRRNSEWAKKNPAKNCARARAWYHRSPENKAKTFVYRDQWRLENPERVNASSRRASARRRCRTVTPAWADRAAIDKIYADCPPGMEVDHIVPIQGKNVCGLHVETNLQYLTKSANSSKGAKWEP